jgi:hypothetical protein
MKYVVDRRTWFRGKGADDSKLLMDNGMRCCIGFVGKQCGISDDDLLGVAEVTAMHYDKKKFPTWMREPYSLKGKAGLTVIGQAYHTNDDENINDEQREARLKEIFAEAGDEIIFEN